jgi:DNA-binding transcriptional ArsR family regulator
MQRLLSSPRGLDRRFGGSRRDHLKRATTLAALRRERERAAAVRVLTGGGGATSAQGVRSDSLNQPVHQFKAEFFKALAHPARIKILEFLRGGERTVGEIQAFLDIEPAATSQQLGVLRLKNIVSTRKEGSSVYYAVRDPAVFELLDVARRIFNNHLIDTRDMLAELAREDDVLASRSPSKSLA